MKFVGESICRVFFAVIISALFAINLQFISLKSQAETCEATLKNMAGKTYTADALISFKYGYLPGIQGNIILGNYWGPGKQHFQPNWPIGQEPGQVADIQSVDGRVETIGTVSEGRDGIESVFIVGPLGLVREHIIEIGRRQMELLNRFGYRHNTTQFLTTEGINYSTNDALMRFDREFPTVR